MELKDSVVLVTGAGRGIGRALALAVAREGAQVGLMGLTASHLLAVESEVKALGARAAVLVGDVSDEGSVSRCVAAAEQKLGPIDVLVNNAGVFAHGSVDRLDALVFDHTLAVNLRGPFLLARAVLPGMKSRRRGHVVNIASTAGRRGFAGGAAYCASKYGLAGLSEAMLHDVRGHDVRVTCLFPSTVATDMARRGGFLKDADKAIRPEDVAEAVLGLLRLDARVLPVSLELWQTTP
ncbi:MAG: SDR family NAD(P)-dependent oxidoreductase [Thermoanaerobaculia bacterium]|nr:SDR family NAD(P)-dependent oxidoreductase [Thermoanaerobaculia bacterium]